VPKQCAPAGARNRESSLNTIALTKAWNACFLMQHEDITSEAFEEYEEHELAPAVFCQRLIHQ
jgi:hypothetical protein